MENIDCNNPAGGARSMRLLMKGAILLMGMLFLPFVSASGKDFPDENVAGKRVSSSVIVQLLTDGAVLCKEFRYSDESCSSVSRIVSVDDKIISVEAIEMIDHGFKARYVIDYEIDRNALCFEWTEDQVNKFFIHQSKSNISIVDDNESVVPDNFLKGIREFFIDSFGDKDLCITYYQRSSPVRGLQVEFGLVTYQDGAMGPVNFNSERVAFFKNGSKLLLRVPGGS